MSECRGYVRNFEPLQELTKGLKRDSQNFNGNRTRDLSGTCAVSCVLS